MKKKLDIFINCPSSLENNDTSVTIYENTELSESEAILTTKIKTELIKEILLKKLKERESTIQYYHFPDSIKHKTPTFKSNALESIVKKSSVRYRNTALTTSSFGKNNTVSTTKPRFKSLIRTRIRVMLSQRTRMKSCTRREQPALERNESAKMRRLKFPLIKECRSITLRFSFKDSRSNAKEKKLRNYIMKHNFLRGTLSRKLNFNNKANETAHRNSELWKLPVIS